jgi:hypothetical protein
MLKSALLFIKEFKDQKDLKSEKEEIIKLIGLYRTTNKAEMLFEIFRRYNNLMSKFNFPPLHKICVNTMEHGLNSLKVNVYFAKTSLRRI